ncbi:MAG TPA: class I SAM-dependent methyltransferase, partial [Phenylobacterium sp.]
PQGARVLDIGCGSGDIAAAIMARRPDVAIQGVDVFVRPETRIPVAGYDGKTLPYADQTFDVAMMVDVLHHTDDPAAVMAEAKRVAKQGVLIKDHFRDGLLAGPTLRFMDWVGNAPHGVRLPYNYLSGEEWRAIWSKLSLAPSNLRDKLGIYPAPFSWVFDRGLHFVTLLRPAA